MILALKIINIHGKLLQLNSFFGIIALPKHAWLLFAFLFFRVRNVCAGKFPCFALSFTF